jgi:hypothetical protein
MTEPHVMTREDFIAAHRAECRRYFEILAAVAKQWNGPRSSADGFHDEVARYAAEVQRQEGPTLLDRMRAGALVVTGFVDTRDSYSRKGIR